MTKRIRLSALVALFVASILFIVLGFSFVKVNHVVKAESLITFEEGASIRLDVDNNSDETTGIRFTTNVSESLYDSDEIGMIVIPQFVQDAFKAQSVKTDYFEYLLSTYGADVKDVSQSISKEDLIANEGVMNGVIADIKTQNYDKAYTAIAYYKTGETITYVECGFSRKIVDVAVSALKSNDSFSAQEYNVLSSVVQKSIDSYGVETLAVGKTIDLGSEFTDEIMGKDVSWSVKSGSEKVKLAVGGDNIQAVSTGEVVLTASAFNGNLKVDIKLDCQVSNNAEDIVDFVVEVPNGRDIRVLQITDTQLVDSAQASMSGLNEQYTPERFEQNCFKYIREAVERTDPDFIIMTGDNVWGAFDDAGTSLTALIGVLDSFQVPWASVYGNHDNESEKGAQWQNEQYQHSQYGLFLRGVTDGNGNYTVGLKQDGKIKRVFCMMDTNLCSGAYQPAQNYVTTTMGFTNGQVEWFNRTMAAIHVADQTLPVSMGYHVPNYAFDLAMMQYEADLVGNTTYYTLGLDVEAREGDFGSHHSMGRIGAGGMIDYENNQVKTYGGKTLLELYKEAKVDSVFVGHQHSDSLSLNYEGIRWTFGLKTGVYDHMNMENMGGTLITVDDENSSVTVKHVYYDEEYQAYRDGLISNPKNNVTVAGAEVGGTNKNIYPDSTQRMNVTREYVDGYGAYRIDSMTQRELRIDNSLIEGKASMTFSYLVPSNCTNNISGMGSPFTVYMYGTSAHYVWFKPIKNGTGDFNYDEWTTATVDFNFNGDRCTSGRWILAPESAIYLKDITFIDAEPKSDVAINVTVNKDGVADTDTTLKDKIVAYIEELYYLTGDMVDITQFVKENVPNGFKLDGANSTLSAEVPSEGALSFVVNLVTYVEEPVEGTGNLVTTLVSSGKAKSGLTNKTDGELFLNSDNYLYFNCFNPSLDNEIVFDPEFVQECFANGYTNIKVSFYVTSLADGAWIKIGPAHMKADNSWSYFSARSQSDNKWLNKTTMTKLTPVELTWVLSPAEVASIDFSAGDTLVIAGLGAGSSKTQVVFTHFEFCKPTKNYNLVGLADLFDAEKGVMGKVYNCGNQNNDSCWIQYYDVDASVNGGYSKVIDIRKHNWCDPVVYIQKDYVNALLKAGYTQLNIVSGYTTQYGRTKATPVLYDYDLLENWSNSIKPTTTGTEDATTKQTKYTFDLTGKTFDNYLSIFPSSSVINAVMYIYEISFSKPAN